MCVKVKLWVLNSDIHASEEEVITFKALTISCLLETGYCNVCFLYSVSQNKGNISNVLIKYNCYCTCMCHHWKVFVHERKLLKSLLLENLVWQTLRKIDLQIILYFHGFIRFRKSSLVLCILYYMCICIYKCMCLTCKKLNSYYNLFY